MEIINLVVICDGILTNIDTYIVNDEKKRKTLIKKLEKEFTKKMKKFWVSPTPITNEDIEEALDNGNYDNQCGDEVIINWSSKIITK